MKDNLEKILGNRWWHNIDLGIDIFTPGVINCEKQWKEWDLPNNLKGKSILDVGCWDGGFSKMAEEKGADKVIGIDFSHGEENFNFLKKYFNLKMQFLNMDLFEIPKQKLHWELWKNQINKPFDIIFYFGVYYHLKNPLEAFEILYDVCKEEIWVEGLITFLYPEKSLMIFFEKDFNKDFSNWWSPNLKCLKEMLNVSGFEVFTEKITETSIGNDKDFGRIFLKCKKVTR